MYELVLVGASFLAGFLVSLFFYRQSSKDLVQKTKELCRLDTLMLRGIEEGELVKFNRDKNGKITGMVVNLAGKATAQSHLESKLSNNQGKSGEPPDDLASIVAVWPELPEAIRSAIVAIIRTSAGQSSSASLSK